MGSSDGTVVITHNADSSQMRAEYQKTLATQDQVIEKLREEVRAAKETSKEKEFYARQSARKQVQDAKNSFNEQLKEKDKATTAEIQKDRMKMVAKNQLLKQEVVDSKMANKQKLDDLKSANKQEVSDAVAAERKIQAQKLQDRRHAHKEQIKSLLEKGEAEKKAAFTLVEQSRAHQNAQSQAGNWVKTNKKIEDSFKMLAAGIVSGGGIAGAIYTTIHLVDELDNAVVNLNKKMLEQTEGKKRFASSLGVGSPLTTETRVAVKSSAANQAVNPDDAIEVAQSLFALKEGRLTKDQLIQETGYVLQGMRAGAGSAELMDMGGMIQAKGGQIWESPYLAYQAGKDSHLGTKEMVEMGRSMPSWKDYWFMMAAGVPIRQAFPKEAPAYLSNAGSVLNLPDYQKAFGRLGVGGADEVTKILALSRAGIDDPAEIANFFNIQDKEKILGLSNVIKNAPQTLSRLERWKKEASPDFVRSQNDRIANSDPGIRLAESQQKALYKKEVETTEVPWVGGRTQAEILFRQRQAAQFRGAWGFGPAALVGLDKTEETGELGLLRRYLLWAQRGGFFKGRDDLYRQKIESLSNDGVASSGELREAIQNKTEDVSAKLRRMGIDPRGNEVVQAGIREGDPLYVTTKQNLIAVNEQLNEFGKKLGIAQRNMTDLGRLPVSRNGAGIE
jgi:hypothetical protein